MGFISIKFIDIHFIKFKKTSNWKKITYLLIYKIHRHKIYQFKIYQHKIYQFKIHRHKFYQALKMPKWKKVTYFLIYEKSSYDENVGFTKLIK